VAIDQPEALQLAQSLCNRRPGGPKAPGQGQVARQTRSVFVLSALNPLMEMLEDDGVFRQGSHPECHYSFLHKATLLNSGHATLAQTVVLRHSRAVTQPP
jgi:hypothetical protein